MKEDMDRNPAIIFVCEHGAAKSILAAAYFNRLARDKDFRLTATARGTQPDAELSSQVIDGLRNDGLTPTQVVPTKLDMEEVESARRVVSFSRLPEEYSQIAIIEYWDNIPPVSEGYERARDAIIARLKELIETL